MPAETIARPSALSGTPDEDDYQAFCQTLSASERGRAFLAEYARRNRGADTRAIAGGDRAAAIGHGRAAAAAEDRTGQTTAS